MSSSSILQAEMESVMQRRRKQALAEFARGREALNMRGLIDDFEDSSFMEQADMRRIRAESVRRKGLEQMETLKFNEAYARKNKLKDEEYHRQQEQEAIEMIAALRSARKNIETAGEVPSPLAPGYLNTNVARFSDVTGNRVLLHEQKLRERALLSAHIEKMRIQNERQMQNSARNGLFFDFERDTRAEKNRMDRTR
jgi:hypothetical protein